MCVAEKSCYECLLQNIIIQRRTDYIIRGRTQMSLPTLVIGIFDWPTKPRERFFFLNLFWLVFRILSLPSI